MVVDKPIIAVTGPAWFGFKAWVCTQRAVSKAGGRALRVTSQLNLNSLTFDALILGGGTDLNPKLYGDLEQENYRYDNERDSLEQKVLEIALLKKKPILGICRGSQMINVFMGGTLIPDIKHMFTDYKHRYTVFPRKAVVIHDDTLLNTIIEDGEIDINALHHQAVKQLGSGLKVGAVEPNGVIQATELEDPYGNSFLLGVQWHPEYLFYLEKHMRLFKALVDAARHH